MSDRIAKPSHCGYALIIGVLCCAQTFATTITVPPGNWVFENTAGMTATDFEIIVLNSSLDFDPRSTGGTAFPNPTFVSGTVSGQPAAFFNSLPNVPGQPQGPGIPSGGFYPMDFTGYPAGTQLDVLFSYSGHPAQDPGRVYRQVNETMFEFVPDLSPAGPPTVPPPDFSSLVGGQASAVPEPPSGILVGISIVCGMAYGWRRRRKIYSVVCAYDQC